MCFFPTTAQSQEFGKPKLNPEGDLTLPCGKCSECISKRSIEWSLRARHEISLHNENCFLTLTYNDEYLPNSNDPIKHEFQKFIKRLRKKIKKKIRYMVSHEYGSNTKRLHHHAIIFGYDPLNQKFLKTTKSGESIFTSTDIDSLWGLGHHSIGSANAKTAYYIASYALKGKKHQITDLATGEIKTVTDSMDVSKRPAIGYIYFDKNQKQLVNTNQMLPRYYLKRLQIQNPDLYEIYENKRSEKLLSRSSYELRAKYIIDSSKNLKNEFRTPEDTSQESSHQKKQLTHNADEFRRQNKEKKK